ncbi:MAG: alpha/beta hydrolase [Eubacteriales bacterium]|nr:alpha/beta hydrolase [Eubacteriales bacterium]
MTTIQSMLAERGVMGLCSRETMLAMIQREVYGMMPPPPEEISFEEGERSITPEGAAEMTRVTVRTVIGGKPFAFPVIRTMPAKGGKVPFFVMINFRPDVPDKYLPIDVIARRGFAVLSLCYQDVAGDDGDFTGGLAGVLFPEGRRGAHDAGKIAMWAWAAQRVMDYAVTLPQLDHARGTVCGHSRLGKTALLAAASDQRFAYAYSNDSGCSGAALARGTTGETVADICGRFPFWFSESYLKYAGHEADMKFDQHWLMACIAPRYLIVGSASEDAWADPVSEFLGCCAASPMWQAHGLPGLVTEDDVPDTPQMRFDGCVGYHLREGGHAMTEEDWRRLMHFVETHPPRR